MVSGMRFQTSPHVDHFRNNTFAYTEGLRRFVADALALTDPPILQSHASLVSSYLES